MIITIILGIITILLAYIARHKKHKILLKFAFIIIFIFLAIRYNFGNDYSNYHKLFLEIEHQGYKNIFDYKLSLPIEPAWIALNIFFQPFGFYCLVASVSLFMCYVYYNFIIKYVPPTYYWLAIFIFVFNPNFLVIQLSAIRQSVAICLVLISFDFILKKEFLYFALCIVAASLFHSSAMIFLPLYFIIYFPKNIKLFTKVIIFGIFAGVIVFYEYIGIYVNLFVASYFPKYITYNTGSSISSGFGLGFNAIMLLLLLIYYNSGVHESKQILKKTPVDDPHPLSRDERGFQRCNNACLVISHELIEQNSFFLKIAIISYLIIPVGFIISIIGRIEWYLIPAHFIAFPFVFNRMEPFFKTITLALFISYNVANFYLFFYSDIYHSSYFEYQTIFSSFFN